MDYDKQMQWLDYQISELEAKKENLGTDFESTDDYISLQALTSIRKGYKKAHQDSISYSYVQFPDMTGK